MLELEGEIAWSRQFGVAEKFADGRQDGSEAFHVIFRAYESNAGSLTSDNVGNV